VVQVALERLDHLALRDLRDLRVQVLVHKVVRVFRVFKEVVVLLDLRGQLAHRALRVFKGFKEALVLQDLKVIKVLVRKVPKESLDYRGYRDLSEPPDLLALLALLDQQVFRAFRDLLV
jgi:hypothetical protein